MRQFLRENFDKLLLVFLIIVFVIVSVFTSAADWATRSIDMFSGALVGVITGHYLRKPEEKTEEKQ